LSTGLFSNSEFFEFGLSYRPGLPPGLVLRLLLLLHVGRGLAAPVPVVDLDHLFAGRLIAALRLCRWSRSSTFAFATGHSQTVHRPAA
jgi:hypothetical protein